MITVMMTVLLSLLAISIPVAAVLATTALVLGNWFSFLNLTPAIGELAWSSSTSFILVAVPLFILLGEILLRSGIAERMYGA
ncbi:MAG TPA: TRAP transporter large permease subunit, partial [Alphaproteobacteria bacterium]|nr:TRAP transporter large permease subunit [Alphaproteobacteria bacterium]